MPAEDYLAEVTAQQDVQTRRVALTRLRYRGAVLDVSTVFLGWNAAPGRHPPLLWETAVMLAGTKVDQCRYRYASERAARHGHHAVVAAIRGPQPRRRPAPAPGPWRRSYPTRWRPA